MDKKSSEIVNLTERISKDPKSKLFVPLAEEYKKIGDVEMAVHVLTEGLKNNPGYVTARAILGRLLIEQGDLAGAQKELLEVVKVIPDNLLAQRKLGDTYVLQNNPNEALKHYKIVLSLSPRDEEIVSLISDIEAGTDVSARLQQPKAQPPLEAPVKPAAPHVKPEIKPQVKQEPAPQTQAMPPKVPASEPPGSQVKQEPAPQAQATPPKAPVSPVEQPPEEKITEPVPTAAPAAAMAAEEPEDIIMVEPLEKEKAEPGTRATGLDFLAEQEQTDAYAPSGEEPAETPFAPMEQAAEAGQPIVAEKTIEPVPAVTQEQSDDFTTDTLAELYITQGFYEKAIDIYERMLNDNPNSRGLKEKLEGVKAMAAATSAAEAEKPGVDIFAEPQVYSAQEGPAEEKAGLFSAPEEELPAAKTKEWPKQEKDAEAEALPLSPEPQVRQAKPVYTDFEPREYVPPQAEAEPVAAPVPSGEENTEKAHVAPKSATAIRKDTIDRLEAWLKNIKKES